MLRIRKLCRPGLSPVDLEVTKGECVAVSGPSGAGKTLFLRAIADLDANEGEVFLDGTSRAAMPAPAWRRKVGYLATESGWWADTVAEHFADWDAVKDTVRRLGLPDDSGTWAVSRLSTGERQRLALLRLLIQRPPVLLLDEPTSALDAETTAAVETMLRERLADGVAILLVSHDAGQIERLATRRLSCESGRIEEVGRCGSL